MGQIDWVEWFGYFASVMVLISFLCSSVVRLRCISLFGSTLFGIYGFMIHSYPTGVLNLSIALINLWYLLKMRNKKEYFSVLDIAMDDHYLQHFLKFFHDEIEKDYQNFSLEGKNYDVCFNVLRDMVTASVFFGKKWDEETLEVCMDFVIPAYRDMKVGRYIYNECQDKFLDLGYKSLVVRPYNKDNEKYLQSVGFEPDGSEEGLLRKALA